MIAWLLVYVTISAGAIASVGIVAVFPGEVICNEARRKLPSIGLDLAQARCVEVALGEDA